uniref:Uncharacterized protein n=1 Tax=Bradyrhizobium ottawaense TaxID=931866 RepID=A0A2U8P3W8_9BRAD|nr:hypothetical protein CIT37_09035 [Bradyrhizobium ottawaense]
MRGGLRESHDNQEHRSLNTSLRAQRSNPESLRGKMLDCFAALAMTMWGLLRNSTNSVPAESPPHPDPLPASGERGRARAHFILHLSWKRSWSFSTMVATVFSESWPSASFTTSWR